MTEVRIGCAILGGGSAFPVMVKPDELVGELKEKIAAKKSRTVFCDADQLTLYLAKKRDDTWLDASGAEMKTLLKGGDASEETKGLLKEPMEPMSPLGGYLGSEFAPGSFGEIHVLVQLPDSAKANSSADTAPAVGPAIMARLEEVMQKLDQVAEKASDTKRRRYTHSKVSSRTGKALLRQLNIQVEPFKVVPSAAGQSAPVAPFEWGSVVDGSGEAVRLFEEQQRDRYRAYVEANIAEVLADNELCVIGVERGQDILNVEVPGCNIDLSGRTDLLILSDAIKENPSDLQYLPRVKMLIEVKTKVEASNDFQAVSELIALDLIVTEPVMALLTDLGTSWHFFWVSSERKAGRAAIIYKATVKNPGDAFQVIRTMLAQPATADEDLRLPCFQHNVKRRKLAEMLPASSEENAATGLQEAIERYNDIASFFGPDIDMARATARQIVRSMPVFSFYS